jgi:biopolymer transport protein ExbD
MAAKLGGTKGGKYALGQNADINVTPFVDIMLVLLIIFMVSIPPATIAIKVDLPPAVNNPQQINAKPTYISIRDNGDIMIVDKQTTLASLTDDLVVAMKANPAMTNPNPKEETVLIRADRLVRYKDFMQVVNQLQTEGFYKVALINENLGGG